MRLAIEPINRYETTLVTCAADGLELIERTGATNVGLLLDTFHMNIEERSIEGAIRRCGARIFHFHVADSNRGYPGSGHLDFRRIIAALADTGYDGFVSGEFIPQGSPERAAELTIRNLRAACEGSRLAVTVSP